MKIVQVNSTDIKGGAAQVASNLHNAYRSMGQDSWQVVGHKLGDDPYTVPIRHDLYAPWWQRPFWIAGDAVARHPFRGGRMLGQFFRMCANPHNLVDWYSGIEEFHYPGTKYLLNLTGNDVDILHLHNLHGHYFDLRQLPNLSHIVPTVLSLHDTWLLSGHCAFSFDCERWQTGCGQCPDLAIEPSIRRDQTAANWLRKKDIFSKSQYHLISPSKWLAEKVKKSVLMAGLQSMEIIPHGIDLNFFQPGNKTAARQQLGLPQDQRIILMVANGFRKNPWKDFNLAQNAFEIIGSAPIDFSISIRAIGDNLPDENFRDVALHFIPYISDKTLLAKYYQAADVLLSTSKVEVWGLVISEALACGRPVIAPAVGGIPDQVSSWTRENNSQANGILFEPGNVGDLAEAILGLLNNPQLMDQLGANAAQYAKNNLNFDLQVERTINFYNQIISDWKSNHAG